MPNPRYKMPDTGYKRGFGLIEIIIVLGISALLISSFYGIIGLATSIVYRSENTIKALKLAEEAMEAARIFRDRTDWASNGLGSLTIGNYYRATTTANNWDLVSGQETIGGSFKRFIQFDRVYRDANSNIAPSGTEDPLSRKVTVRVQGIGAVKISGSEIKLTTYLMNWR